MKKVKNNLVSTKKGLPTKESDKKQVGQVSDLHPKAKNLPDTLKGNSLKKGKKIGQKESVPLSPNLKK